MTASTVLPPFSCKLKARLALKVPKRFRKIETVLPEEVLGLPETLTDEMKKICRRYGLGPSKIETIDQVLKFSDPAGGNNGNPYRGGNRPNEFMIVAAAGAIPVYGGQEYFPCPELLDSPRDLNGTLPTIS